MAHWLVDYANPTKSYNIDRNYKTMERECQERGEKQACKSRFYEIWHEKFPDVKVNTCLSDLNGVNTNNLGFEQVNKVFTQLLFNRIKGKHPWKNQGSSFHLTKCSKDLQNRFAKC